MVVVSGSFHLGCIVAVTKFGETEAPHVLKAINLFHNWQVTLRVQTSKGTAEQIELHCEFSGEIAINLSNHLVSSKNILRISLEIKN